MLQHDDIVRFLLCHRLLDEKQVVDGSLRVIDASRRNHNFKIISDTGPSYFIKQGVGIERARTVSHEADTYHFLAGIAGSEQLAGFLPILRLHDPERCIVVLEMSGGARSLMDYHATRRSCSARLAGSLGKALATFHKLTTARHAVAEYARLHVSNLPFALYIHRPDLSVFRYASQGVLDLITTVQGSSALCAHLDDIQEGWRHDCLIHNDLRWDNCSIHIRPGTARTYEIRLVDWELACLGDPCWDIGTIFSEYLSFWLRSAPLSGATAPEKALQLAECPIQAMHAAIRSFWDSYVRRMRLSRVETTDWLCRALRYASARLIQTAVESVQLAASVTGKAVCLLQLAHNILERPRDASVQLLGIP